jgi:hypothetical protein
MTDTNNTPDTPADNTPDTPSDDVPVRILEITGADALKALRHVVAEKGPDHYYTPPVEGHSSCVYVWPNSKTDELEPHCIVGYALHHLNVPLELIATSGFNMVNIQGLAANLRHEGYVILGDAIVIFRAAQSIQDAAMRDPAMTGCGCDSCKEYTNRPAATEANWGKALEMAERTATVVGVKVDD